MQLPDAGVPAAKRLAMRGQRQGVRRQRVAKGVREFLFKQIHGPGFLIHN
jgi:hypothetical protein